MYASMYRQDTQSTPLLTNYIVQEPAGKVPTALLMGFDFLGMEGKLAFLTLRSSSLPQKRLALWVILLSSWCFPSNQQERGHPRGKKTVPQWVVDLPRVAWALREELAVGAALMLLKPGCSMKAPCSALLFLLAGWRCGPRS